MAYARDTRFRSVASGADVNHPPFWLPFQDLGTNNHLGQWAQQAFSGTCGAAAADAGAAPDAGGSSSGGSSSGAGSSGGGAPCNTCLDCNGQACNGGQCGSCTDSTQCCAPANCVEGQCILPPQ